MAESQVEENIKSMRKNELHIKHVSKTFEAENGVVQEQLVNAVKENAKQLVNIQKLVNNYNGCIIMNG